MQSEGRDGKHSRGAQKSYKGYSCGTTLDGTLKWLGNVSTPEGSLSSLWPGHKRELLNSSSKERVNIQVLK